MKTKKILLRVLKIAGFSLLGIVLAAVIAILCIWGREIKSLASFKQLNEANAEHQDGYVYTMTIEGDYDFQKLIDQGGVSSDSELIQFISKSITKGLIDINIKTSNIGCSSFTATTDSGDRVFARNYDFNKTNTCIVYTNPGHGRHASVSTCDLQFISIDRDKGVTSLMNHIMCLATPFIPLDGMNDAGVSCGIYMSYQGKETVATAQNTDKPDITSTTMLRMILDYADSVDEAVELVQKYDLHDSANTSYHYMVADSTGKSAILEWVAGTDSTDNDGSKRELKITYNDKNYQVVTNHIIYPGYYDGEPEEEIKGLDRIQILDNYLSEHDGKVIDDADAMKVLSLTGRRGLNKDPKATGITVHSAIYNLTDLTAIWVSNEHYGEEAYTYELKIKK